MSISRRNFTFAALAAPLFMAGCNNGVGSGNAEVIDARADATLEYMFNQFPQTRDLADKSVAMLIMPLVTEAGFGIGGGYGRGALRIQGSTVDYYSATTANIGFQIGAQQYAHVLFFMTEEVLTTFRRSPGWSLGADAEYAFADKGGALKADTTTLNAPIVAVVFGQAGLRAGATLEGQKYSRIIP
ncbi:twin-arginine translocation pathway signal [Pseudooceanicola sp. 216_PA32_1]|uniref:Twin-arginine translocation pathway signal n=1 Tax=Pseudooceanicola pacificus TaxID=2676438 RepID=A0A844W9I6_9RHOB|nr:YSC84-related protein [Pseudooceanicola pacificus]MWB77198.1 twin-arginine translocation pathway signal [Pseudooceanicola pacificus]